MLLDPPPPIPATPLAEVDASIEALHARCGAWRAVSVQDRVALLEACIRSMASAAERWVEVGASIKGLAATERAAGEEWLAGPMAAIRNARLLAAALREGGQPRPAKLRTRDDGRLVARVFPATVMDRVMFAGVSADVWIQKDKPATQGAIYREKSATRDAYGDGRVCLVLGGGNVSSIPPMDVFYKLFAEDEVVLLKMNPVNEALGPVFEQALSPLVAGGWLSIVYGGADVGARAASHPKVGSLHVTGSDRTYDAVVWGATDDERAARKARKERVNERPFSAELGCVTPVIVVPGPWSHSDIRFQARHVAAMITNNASFNCNAAKVIIVAKQWLQRGAFLEAVHDELRRAPARKAYYPGAQRRYAAFLERYPDAKVLGDRPNDGVVPWTVLPDVPDAERYALKNEAFCGVTAEVVIDAPDAGGVSVPRFLEEAVRLANETCWGTLSCCVLVHPATEERYGDAVQRAVEELRYGGIGINVWPGVIYALGSPTWGAFPGHTPEDIQSGSGVVHNASLFDHPEKSVVRAPFRVRPTPAWFSDNANLLELGRRLVDFEAGPSWPKLARVVTAAVRG